MRRGGVPSAQPAIISPRETSARGDASRVMFQTSELSRPSRNFRGRRGTAVLSDTNTSGGLTRAADAPRVRGSCLHGRKSLVCAGPSGCQRRR